MGLCSTLGPTFNLALVGKIDKVPVLKALRISGGGVSRSWIVGAGIRGWRRVRILAHFMQMLYIVPCYHPCPCVSSSSP